MGPDPNLTRIAKAYAAANGIDLRRQSEFAEVDEEFAVRIADAYETMAHYRLRRPEDRADARVDMDREKGG